MLQSRDQLRAFFLADTVPIPSPFPALGRISFELHAGEQRESAEKVALDTLRVEYRQSPRVMIARTVLVEDVQAVFVPEDGGNVDLLDGGWYFRPEIKSSLLACLSENLETTGIVYVRESAPVLMQVEVGMTAAESAEYYPPLARERNDAHYCLTRVATCGCEDNW